MAKQKAPASGDEIRVEYVALGDLKRAPRNAKRHDEPNIAASMTRFGFTAPILLDETSGSIVAGHGRLDVLLARKASGEPAPKRIRVREDGEWLAPVVRGLSFASPAEAEAYLLADNRLVEAGGYDDAELLAILRDVATSEQALAGTGFDEAALAALVASVSGPESSVTIPAGDESDRADVGFAVLIECTGEAEQLDVIAACQEKGWKCRALT